MSALTKVDALRPTATQVIDGDTHAVTLDLQPIAAGLITDIARALHGNGRLMTALANLPASSPEFADIRRDLLTILNTGTALQVVLDVPQADALAADLWDATVEPNWCACAEKYATRPDGLCDWCGASADVAEGSYGQLRAV